MLVLARSTIITRLGSTRDSRPSTRAARYVASIRLQVAGIEGERSCQKSKNKVVVITGASSGIDEATALLLAERDAKVVLGARGQDRLAALADRIARAGGEAASASTVRPRRVGSDRLGVSWADPIRARTV